MKKLLPTIVLAGLLFSCSGSDDYSLGSGAVPSDGTGGTLDNGGGEFGGGTGGAFDVVPAETRGLATYTFIPPRSRPNGENSFLAFNEATERPIRKARVALLDESDVVQSETVTADDGSFVLPNPNLVPRVKVRVYSQTGGEGNQRVRVQDNTNGGILYAADSPVTDVRVDPSIELRLASGYDPVGNITIRQRPSAPFAVLDSILLVAEAFNEDPASLPEVKVNWSINNSSAEGRTDRGAISTSHYDSGPNALFILGKANNDTDEYDWHVMVHEFGHWYQANAGRSDGIGGTHGAGDIKDPRLAFGEGYGNALGGIVLHDSVYKDTSGNKSSMGINDDLERNNESDSATRGWYSESTVAYMIYDMFDPINPQEASGFNDQIELPFSVLRDGLQYQKAAPALTTIFSFLEGVAPRIEPQALQSLLAFHTRNADFGINATDQWAAAETHDAGMDSLPLYRDGNGLINAGPQPLSVSGENGNELDSYKYYRLTGNGQRIRVRVASAEGGVEVFENGKMIRPGAQAVAFPSIAGATYILVVGLADAGNLNTTFTVSSP